MPYHQFQMFFRQQETLSSSLHKRHTRRRWGRPIPPEPDTKNVLYNLKTSWPATFLWLSRQLNYFPSQVQPSTCSALLGRAVLLSRLPPSPYIDENIDTCPEVFSTFQWQVGVSTSGHFYLCWMLPLPSWNWPADAAAQPTCRRSSWKVKVKTKVEIEKNYVTVCWHLSQPALSWSWKMWHHCFREATRVELVLGTRLLWIPDCLISNSNLCRDTNFQCYVTYNISMNWNRSPCKRKDRKAWIWEHRHRLNICQSPWNSK